MLELDSPKCPRVRATTFRDRATLRAEILAAEETGARGEVMAALGRDGCNGQALYCDVTVCPTGW